MGEEGRQGEEKEVGDGYDADRVVCAESGNNFVDIRFAGGACSSVTAVPKGSIQ